MKKKIFGIVICALLVLTVLPVTGTLTYENDNNKLLSDHDRFYEIDFMIGKVHNISEETKNDTIRYAFHADWIIIIIHAYFPPVGFATKRILDRDVNMSIPKDNFHGWIREGRIFGIWESITL